MYDFDELNPHLALLRSESFVSPEERRWEKWVKTTERLMGHSLDGDQTEDGYSLDYALMLFEDGYTPQEAVTEFRTGSFQF